MSECIALQAGQARIKVLGETNITILAVDAICNSTGRAMHGCGGGVDGAIHRAAGPELAEACRAIAPCGLGEARITLGFRLPAKMIVHTSVPKWAGGDRGELEALANCYRSALQLADRHGARSIAFHALGCGVRGFPLEPGAHTAVHTVREALQHYRSVEHVIFVCRESDTTAVFTLAIHDACRLESTSGT